MTAARKFADPTLPAGHVPVMELEVTAAMLEAWGFPVRKVTSCVGVTVLHKDGETFTDALGRATRLGFARFARTEEREAEFRGRRNKLGQLCSEVDTAKLRASWN
jgi:hypothetical protein